MCMSVIATQPLFVLRLPFIRCFGKAVRDEFRGGWVGGGDLVDHHPPSPTQNVIFMGNFGYFG